MRKKYRSHGKAAGRAPALEWPRPAPGMARATIAGGRRALIENYSEIQEFTPGLVRLSSPNGEIRVTGAALELAEVRPGSLIVKGRIGSVELPGEGQDAHV